MRRQAIFFLVLAVLLGGLAAILALQVLRAPDGAPESVREVATEDVVVAARDIEFGALVQMEDVRTVSWPADALPAGYSRSPSDVVGRGVLMPIRANEPMLSSKLALPEAGAGLSLGIPEGLRAITVRVNDIVGVGGFVRPGHRVDVFVTASDQAGVAEPQTKLLLQNVPVAATGVTIEPNPQGEPENVPNATLHLTPEQVERLIMASQNATFQLALRNPLDGDSVETPGVRFRQLIAGTPAPRAPVASGPAPAAAPRAPAQTTLEVYRGNQRSTSTVDTAVVGGGGGGGGGGQ
jgi:pilus assembly protein CpaB